MPWLTWYVVSGETFSVIFEEYFRQNQNILFTSADAFLFFSVTDCFSVVCITAGESSAKLTIYPRSNLPSFAENLGITCIWRNQFTLDVCPGQLRSDGDLLYDFYKWETDLPWELQLSRAVCAFAGDPCTFLE